METPYVWLPCYFFSSRTSLATSCQAVTPSLWKQCAFNQAAKCRGGVEQSSEEDGEMACSLFIILRKNGGFAMNLIFCFFAHSALYDVVRMFCHPWAHREELLVAALSNKYNSYLKNKQNRKRVKKGSNMSRPSSMYSNFFLKKEQNLQKKIIHHFNLLIFFFFWFITRYSLIRCTSGWDAPCGMQCLTYSLSHWRLVLKKFLK